MRISDWSSDVCSSDLADMDNAVKGAISGIFAATGQTCIAGSRLLVQESIYEPFLDKLLAFARTARMGDPRSPDTHVGPVTTEDQYKKILRYIDIAKQAGANGVLGGEADEGKHGLLQPPIFVGVNNKM